MAGATRTHGRAHGSCRAPGQALEWNVSQLGGHRLTPARRIRGCCLYRVLAALVLATAARSRPAPAGAAAVLQTATAAPAVAGPLVRALGRHGRPARTMLHAATATKRKIKKAQVMTVAEPKAKEDAKTKAPQKTVKVGRRDQCRWKQSCGSSRKRRGEQG
mmetsp:Transcript_34277/g.69270  ORF Transcript_34277/g.69270 Transcript_34277/m.69270 type:complete len:161 (-) Transcript_34277:200-682(-)